MDKTPVIKIAALAAPVEHAGHADHCGPCCAGSPDPVPAVASPTDLAAAPGRSLRIPAMDCSVEESEIRRALDGVAAIRSLRFQLRQRLLTIDAPDVAVQQAIDVIQRIGYEVQPIDTESREAAMPGEQPDPPQRPAAPEGSAWLPKVLLLGMALAVGAEVVGWVAPATGPFKLLGLALAVAAIGCAGLEVYKKGLNALRRGRLNISALMTVAVTGALLIGQWPEAAMVMVLYAVAELIEARAVDRARHAIEGLMALAPEAASVQQADGSWRDQPVAAVAPGALVRVRPGERVPMDGQVTRGQASVNQAPVTGESLPVEKAPGDPVYAGTINQSGSFELRVTAAAARSTLARIIHAVEQAQGSRAPMQRFVDRFAAIYTPAVFAMAVAVALSGPWLFGWTALVAVYKALVLLVIACPCALVISTPVTLVSGLACAARRGMLIKGGVHLEAARRIKVVALDKTGTLTEGRPHLVAWDLLDDAGDDRRHRVGALAAALAGQSDHPVSLAIAQGLPASSLPVTGVAALPGRGVQGTINGVLHRLGNHRLMEDLRLCDARVEAALQVHEAQGRTLALLADDSRVLALFAVADTVKATSHDAVAGLKALGIVPVMLSGDNQTTATAMARQCGIADARGHLLPDDKLAAVRALRAQYGPVAMVGDGINDAPALALADLGVAMGGAGTGIAMEAADVVIMNDDLRRVAEVVHLSRRTHTVLWQNIALALGIKGVFLLLALFGNASMWMAVFADMGASLLVVANGLRLLRSASVTPE